jgi:cytochrome c5
MSQTEHDGGHESPIKTPKQLITVIALAFAVPILIIVLLSQFFANIRSVDKDSEAMAYDAVAKRLKPAGELTFAAAAGGAAQAARSGEDIYKTVCSACHASGAAGAPKFADKAEWAARLKKGQKALLASVISGLKAMPPRGGGADLSDMELERAVVYLANQSGAAFKEPAAPAPAKESAGPAGKPDGKAIYDSACVACHGTGVAGAPKTGDKAVWAPRLKTGMEALYASALKGKGAMPIKGGNTALADADIKAAVDYLVGQGK